MFPINKDGYHGVLAASESMNEDKANWVSFFQWSRGRGLDGVIPIVGDKCLGMLEAVEKVYLKAKTSIAPFISTGVHSPLCPNSRSKM